MCSLSTAPDLPFYHRHDVNGLPTEFGILNVQLSLKRLLNMCYSIFCKCSDWTYISSWQSRGGSANISQVCKNIYIQTFADCTSKLVCYNT